MLGTIGYFFSQHFSDSVTFTLRFFTCQLKGMKPKDYIQAAGIGSKCLLTNQFCVLCYILLTSGNNIINTKLWYWVENSKNRIYPSMLPNSSIGEPTSWFIISPFCSMVPSPIFKYITEAMEDLCPLIGCFPSKWYVQGNSIASLRWVWCINPLSKATMGLALP